MKNDYFEKKEQRIERLNDLAAKNEKLQADLFNRADQMASVIPFGQPILIGHHSEKRDRNYRGRIHSTMGRGVEAGQKAAYYEDKAEAAENNTAISSDNPDAIKLLEEKLASMILFQERCKAINKITRSKKLTREEKEKQMDEQGLGAYKKFLDPDKCWNMIGVPGYELTNNNANMARVKQRIEQLKKVAQMEEKEMVVNSVRIFSSPDTNLVQLFFPGKPAEALRTELKSNGFRWAPSEGAWQKNLSAYAEKQAQDIAVKY